MASRSTIKPSPGGNGPAVQSVARALALLEQVAERGEIGVSQLARAVSLHVATVHNLLRTLTAGGYLVNLAGRYRLGPAAGRLALGWSPEATLPLAARAAMTEMSQTTGETGSLGLLVGLRCEVIPVSRGTGDVVAVSREQTFDRPLAVATGRLLAALGTDDLRERIIRDHVAERRDRTLAAWQSELDRVRADHCAVVRRPQQGSTDAVAVPLVGQGGRVLAALGAHCPNFRGTPAHLVKMLESLQVAAAKIAANLGGAAERISLSQFRNAVRRAAPDLKKGA